MVKDSAGMKKNISRTVFIVMVITLFARFFGLLREVLIAKYYGTSLYTDAYIIANNIPTVLFDTLGQALLTSFIPMYSRVRYSESRDRANVFTIRLMCCLLVICLFIIGLGETFTKEVVYVFASGFKGEALETTIKFSRILFPSLIAMTFLNVFTGYLQIYQKFEISTSVTIVGNLAIIVSLVISAHFNNILIFVWGSLAGLFVQVFFLVPSVLKQGLFKNKCNILKIDIYVVRLIPLLIPVFIGSALNEINSIVDRTMVSSVGTGAVSTLNYAYKVISLVISVIVVPIITILYPKFSEYTSQNRAEKFKESVNKSINYMLAIIIPCTIIVICFRGLIVKILFERGNFGSIAAASTSKSLEYYSFGLIGMAIQQVLIRIFYSKQNTIIPMVNGVLCALVNIALDYILINKFGIYGAAAATSVVAWIACVVLVMILCKKKIISVSYFGNMAFKNVASGTIMIIFLSCFNNLISKNISFGFINILASLLATVISIIIYLLLQIIFKNEDVADIFTDIVKGGCKRMR